MPCDVLSQHGPWLPYDNKALSEHTAEELPLAAYAFKLKGLSAKYFPHRDVSLGLECDEWLLEHEQYLLDESGLTSPDDGPVQCHVYAAFPYEGSEVTLEVIVYFTSKHFIAVLEYEDEFED